MQIVNLDPLPPPARTELYQPTTPPHLGDLAVKLFGTVAGIDLDLPRHSPHEPLELGQCRGVSTDIKALVGAWRDEPWPEDLRAPTGQDVSREPF